MFTDRSYWVAVAERALKTFAQALLACFVAGKTVLSIDWGQSLAVAGTAALLSVLSSMVSTRLGVFDGPSLTSEALVEVDE